VLVEEEKLRNRIQEKREQAMKWIPGQSRERDAEREAEADREADQIVETVKAKTRVSLMQRGAEWLHLGRGKKDVERAAEGAAAVGEKSHESYYEMAAGKLLSLPFGRGKHGEAASGGSGEEKSERGPHKSYYQMAAGMLPSLGFGGKQGEARGEAAGI
jgi:hypothetical protein